MKRPVLILLFIVVLFVSFSVYQNIKSHDFLIQVNGSYYNVIVGVPVEEREQYPLVIYHHGAGYQSLEPFELRELAKAFADEGFLFWAPERTPWSPERTLETLEEARAIRDEILELAYRHPEVDKSNINVVGFSLGSWIVFEASPRSSNVRTVSLLGFGAPYDDAVTYDYVTGLVNSTDYKKITAKILVMVSAEDSRVDIEVGETLRKRMIEANKTIDVVEYPRGDHLSLAGVKNYTADLINYLKGETINTTEAITVDKALKSKWERMRRTGYW
jgi:dienelactone hydrolase